MKAEKLTRWDMAENMKTEEDYAAYLETPLEEGDPAFISAVLGDIARSKGMTRMAKETGLARKSFYRALSANANFNWRQKPQFRHHDQGDQCPRPKNAY